MIQITVNGKSIQVEAGMTVQQLLDSSHVPPNYLAVERNSEVVPREDYADVTVGDGDEIEVVTLVGGG